MTLNTVPPVPTVLDRYSSEEEVLTWQLYKRKRSTPHLDDILNGLYELDRQHEWNGMYELDSPPKRRAFALRIYEAWESDISLGLLIQTQFKTNSALGAFIRAWFEKDFLEVSEIEAEEEMERRTHASGQADASSDEQSRAGVRT